MSLLGTVTRQQGDGGLVWCLLVQQVPERQRYGQTSKVQRRGQDRDGNPSPRLGQGSKLLFWWWLLGVPQHKIDV